ncbi:MAG TPA: ABC transporter permease [Vicinamibacterales bacterium]|nr:ABC transporter permease [Vicinamibacterales bacterium]
MPRPSSAFVRLLLRAYPRHLRIRERDALEAACIECLARERGRLGRLGVAYAWGRLIADTLIAAILLRADEHRRRRNAWVHVPPSAPKEILMTRLWQDIRYAARRLQRAPIFSLAVIATLALTIGATTAVFTVVNAVLLRGLPYRDPSRLVLMQQAFPKMTFGFSPPDYLAFEARAGFVESIAAYRNREYELSGVEPPERVTVTRASATLFDTLGVRPALGRPFTREDDEAGRLVAVLSDALWERTFGRDPAAIGRSILLDRQPFTIVGVMPRGFTFPQRGPIMNNVPADVYVSIGFTAGERRAFGSMYNNSVIARLKAGVTPAQADADTRALVRSNARELYPADLSGLAEVIVGSVLPLTDEVSGRSRTVLWVAFAAVGFVLLIACADIASLMLARAMGREREIAVRSALGAGRGRLIRQLLAESAVLAVVGSVLGLVLAVWLSQALVALAPPTLPRLHEIGIDGRILLFTAALTVVTALLCGILPALELSRPRGEALKEGARVSTGQRERRIFGALVAAQLAIAVVLLVGGGLLLRSFSRLMAVDPGFRAERVLTLATSLPAQVYRDAASVRGFYTRLVDDLSEVPGVSAVGASTELPLGVRERRAFTLEQESPAARDLPHSVAHECVTGRYFEAVGIPLKRGRYFTASDARQSEPVAIINETFARRFWGTADPVGQRIAWGNTASHGPWMRIVGVVGDVKQGALNTETVPHTYTPWLQVSDAMMADNIVAMMRSLRIAVRSEVEPGALARTVRARIRALDPALPVASVQTMKEIVSRSAAVPRFNALLVSLFAALALLLAAIGVGGMLATSISRRLPELGVRMALGAQRRTLVAMVIRQGMILAAAGLAVGLPSAWLLSRALSSLLFEISPRDPITFATVAGLMAIVALIACAVPAWRVTRVDPLTVLRME